MKKRRDIEAMKSIARKIKSPCGSIAKFIEPTPAAVMKQKSKSTSLQANEIPGPSTPKEITDNGAPLSKEQQQAIKDNAKRREAGRLAKKEAKKLYPIDQEIKGQMSSDKDLSEYDKEEDDDLVIG